MSTRVLCVHDHAEELDRLLGALENAGYEVVPASNGKEALHYLKSGDFNGVVLDYDTLAPNGVSLRNSIRHLCPDMPLLMFSHVSEIEHIPLNVFRAYLDDPSTAALALVH